MNALPENDLKKYKTFGLTILQLMSVLAVIGIVVAFAFTLL